MYFKSYIYSTSVATIDEFPSEQLENERLIRIISTNDFSLLVDETINMAEKAVLSIFIRYVDSDSYKVKEEYLVEVVGSKCTDEFCKKICEVLLDKGIDIKQLRFHGYDGTNTMGKEQSYKVTKMHATFGCSRKVGQLLYSPIGTRFRAFITSISTPNRS